MTIRADGYSHLFGPRGERTIVLPHAFAVWMAQSELLALARKRPGNDRPQIDACLAALALANLESGSVSPRGTVSAPVADTARGLQQSNTVSTQTVADRLNCTRRTITRACEEGRLTARKDDGGRWRISAHDADRFVAEMRDGTAA